MPKKIDLPGLVFHYPDNWIADEEDSGDGSTVTIISPNGGFWTVVKHPGSADVQALADSVLETMRKEYDSVDAEAISESIGERAAVGFDFNFFFVDYLNAAQVRCIQCDQAAYVILCQAEDREFDQIHKVFEAMTFDLLQNS